MSLLRFAAATVSLLLLSGFYTAAAQSSSADGAPKSSEEDSKVQERLTQARQGLNVHMFASPMFAPMFGIIAGLSIVLIVAITFIVVGLFSMEPAKDSIIYRMTTTRLKKD